MQESVSRRAGAGWYLALLLFLFANPAAAASGDGHFEVRSVYTEFREGVYYLNGRVSFHFRLMAWIGKRWIIFGLQAGVHFFCT